MIPLSSVEQIKLISAYNIIYQSISNPFNQFVKQSQNCSALQVNRSS